MNRSDAIAAQLTALIANKRDGKLAQGLNLGAASVMQWQWKELALKIEAIAQQEQIECGFRRVDGFLFAYDASADADIDHELDDAVRAATPAWKP